MSGHKFKGAEPLKHDPVLVDRREGEKEEKRNMLLSHFSALILLAHGSDSHYWDIISLFAHQPQK